MHLDLSILWSECRGECACEYGRGCEDRERAVVPSRKRVNGTVAH